MKRLAEAVPWRFMVVLIVMAMIIVIPGSSGACQGESQAHELGAQHATDISLKELMSVSTITPTPSSTPAFASVGIGQIGTYWRYSNALVIDNAGTAHACYYNATNCLIYAKNDGSGWVIYNVTKIGPAVSQLALAVDGDGFAHIAYIDFDQASGHASVFYATNLGGWSKEVVAWQWFNLQWVPMLINGYCYPDVKVDSSGTVYVAFQRSDQNIALATKSGGQWSNMTLPGQPALGGDYLAMQVTSSKYVMIAYYVSSDRSPWFVSNETGSWQYQVIDQGSPSNNIGTYIKMKLDPNEEPVVSYVNESNHGLRLASRQGGSWDVIDFTLTGASVSLPSMALDQNGHAFITYDNYANWKLCILNNRSGSWELNQFYTHGGSDYAWSTPAVDPSGKVHVLFNDWITSQERYFSEMAVPGAPTGLTAVNDLTNGHANLSWAAPSSNGGVSITNYRIYRGTTSGGEDPTPIDIVGNVTTYVDTSTTLGQTYWYQVSANNSVGEGPRSSEVSVLVGTKASAPRNLAAIAGDTSIALSWDAPSSDGGGAPLHYNIYRKVSTVPGDYSLQASSISGITWTDTAVTEGPIYYYKATCSNSFGEGPFSNEVSATLLAMPTAPTLVTAVPGNGQVALTWTAPDDDGGSDIINYTILRGATSGGESLIETVGNVLSYIDTGLINGQTYYYQVRAVNAVGTGPTSNELSAIPATVPDAPQNLEAVPGNEQTDLSWSVPASNGGSPITGYKVYRGETPGAETLHATLGNVLIYSDTGLINGQAYYYKVSAVNSMGEGASTSEVSAVPADVPSAPTLISATPSDGMVSLAWTEPGSNGAPITNYTVYRGTSSGSLEVLIKLGLVLAFTDTGLTNGVSYYYAVSATSSAGEGLLSNELIAVPATVPSVPQDLQATPSNGGVTLTWSAPVSNGGSAITGYVIYRGTSAGAEELLTTIGDVLTFTDTGLTNGMTYYYFVSAVNIMGEGTSSAEASAIPRTTPSAPQSFTVTAGPGQATLTWSPPSDDGGVPVLGYWIYVDDGSGMVRIADVSPSVFTYVKTGLVNGAAYNFTVSANNSAGEGPMATAQVVVPFTVPNAPDMVSTVAGLGEVEVAWSAPLFDGGSDLLGYKVLYGTSVGTLAQFDGLILTSQSSLSVTGLSDGTTYYFAVVAVNAAGDSEASAVLQNTTFAAPAEVGGLEATASQSEVVLTWASPSDGGSPLLSYNVYRGTTTTDLALIGTSTTNVYTDTSVTSGSTYVYGVVATNAVGDGQMATISGVTIPGPPILYITGVVTDGDGDPLEGAKVSLENGSFVLTDAQGHFNLSALAGDHTLTINHDGMETRTKSVTLGSSNEDLGTIELTPTPSDDTWLYIAVGGGVAAVVLLLLFFFLWRRRKKEEDGKQEGEKKQ